MVFTSSSSGLARYFMKTAIARGLQFLTLSWALSQAPGVCEAQTLPDPVPTAVPATTSLTLLPGGILPDSPLAQVIKLAQAGVDADIIQAYITNSTSTFNLDADKIIYLKDVGLPNNLSAAMMQHDQLLHAQIAAATPPPVIPPVAPPPPSPPAPAGDSSTGDDSGAPVVTVNYFYDQLAVYGNWVMIDGYGRCWQPEVAVYQPDWQPYGDQGHWLYTDSGWYWVSDYSWGWAPFHYGRWLQDARFGWCWCPDTVWGPSWVTWRYSNDYCGWAPLPPGSEYVDGSGFLYDGSLVADDSDFGLASDSFIFVTIQDFCDPHPARHRLDRGRSSEWFHQTTASHHYDRDDRHGFINHGIDPGRITRVTHVPLPPLAIHETTGAVGRSGHGEVVNGGAVIVHHPQFQDNHSQLAVGWNGAPPAPGREPVSPEWQNQPPATTYTPALDQPPVRGNGYVPAPAAEPPRYENSEPRPGHVGAPPQAFAPAPAPARYENSAPSSGQVGPPPQAYVPPPEIRREPAAPEPPAAHEPPKPAEPPHHESPPPEPEKSSKTTDQKTGPH